MAPPLTPEQQHDLTAAHAEYLGAVRALIKEHGRDTAMVATALANCNVLVTILRDAGVTDPVLGLVQKQFEYLLASWGSACCVEQEIVERLAAGLREHAHIIEADFTESVQLHDGEERHG